MSNEKQNTDQKNGGTVEKLFSGFTCFLRFCLFWFLGIFLIAPLVGSIGLFAGIRFHYAVWAVILVLAAGFGVLMLKSHLFQIGGVRELAVYGAVFIVSAAIYIHYSPMLELRQDPSVYMFKTMNLLNYGTDYKPMTSFSELLDQGRLSKSDVLNDEETRLLVEDYGEIQNGTQYKDGKLYTDFYPGGTFFYAMFGMLLKRWAFFGQTVIMMLSAMILYELLKKFTGKPYDVSNLFCTAAFLIAPLIVWFGRGSFSEPSALLYFLLLTLLFFDREHTPVGALMLTILSLYSARIDYVFVMIIAIVLLTQISVKWAAITTAAGVFEIWLFSRVYWIYFNRIVVNDMPLLRYSIPLLVIGWIAGMVIWKFWKKFPEFYRSDFVTAVLVLMGIALAVLAFRDNVVTKYQMADIHEKMMRTYVEDVFDLLFLVFPPVIILGGLLGLYKVQRDEEIHYIPGAFLLGTFVAYSYFFISFGNSPQLYWGMRRYYNVLIPALFICFVMILKGMESKTRLIFSAVCLILSANMFFDSEQIVDYKKLDISCADFQTMLDARKIDVVFYEDSCFYDVSSLLSYCHQEFIPISMADLSEAEQWAYEKGYDNYLFLTLCDYGETPDHFVVRLKKLGENYGKVPVDVYRKKIILHSYRFDSLLEEYGQIQSVVYSKGKKLGDGVVWDDGWMGESMAVDKLKITCAKDSQLVIRRMGYDNYLLDHYRPKDMDLQLVINDEIVIDRFQIEGDNILFDLDQITKIDKIEISSRTFSPAETMNSDDTREMSLDLRLVYIR